MKYTRGFKWKKQTLCPAHPTAVGISCGSAPFSFGHAALNGPTKCLGTLEIPYDIGYSSLCALRVNALILASFQCPLCFVNLAVVPV